jgi:hypothetical protein
MQEFLNALKCFPEFEKDPRKKAARWDMQILKREQNPGKRWLAYLDEYIVIDVDHKNGQAVGIKEFARLCPGQPETFTVKTPHGGYHYWFKRIDNKKYKSFTPIPGFKDVELKADVSTGSNQITHPLSPGYKIVNDVDPMNCPGWLHLLLQPLKITETSSAQQKEDPITSGGRHKAMVTFAASMRYSGLSQDEILAALKTRNSKRCVPPLEDKDIEQIASDYAKKGTAKQAEQHESDDEPPIHCYDGEEHETKCEDSGEPYDYDDLKEEPVEKKSHEFALTRISKIKLEPPDYTVEDLIPVESIGQFYGDTGTYKTFYTVAMACCVATGKPFFGKRTKPGPVIYIAGEGRGGIIKRFTAWSIVNEVPMEDLNVYISSGPRDMIDDKSVGELIVTIKNLLIDHQIDYPPGLIFLDTFARNFGPGDENKTSDVNKYISALDRVKAHFGCSTLSIHHVGLVNKERARGSISNRQALDVEYYFEKDDENVLRVVCTKTKDDAIPEPMAFTSHLVDLGILDKHDKKVTSLVLNNIDWTEKPQKGKEDKGRNQGIMLDILGKHEKGLSVEEWKQLSKMQGVSMSSFYRNKDKWFNDKLIRIYSGMVFLGGEI